MADPEELIIDAARHASVFVTRLWQRNNQSPADTHSLLAIKHRLELLLAAAYDGGVRIRVAQLPPPRTALTRLFKRMPSHLLEPHALPAHDGRHIFLPLRLPVSATAPLAIFRILALQQAGRALRSSALPRHTNTLVQDLFELSEAATVDFTLARDFPGLIADLLAVRRSTLADRLRPTGLNVSERALEDLYVRLLQAAPATLPAPLVLAATAADSLTWASAVAERITATEQITGTTARYRGVRKGLWLGEILPAAAQPDLLHGSEPAADAPLKPQRQAQLARRPEVREPHESEDEPQEPGQWMLPMDDPQQHVEDPLGMQRPTDRDDSADPDELADSLAELPEARLISSPRPAHEVLLTDDELDRRALTFAAAPLSPAGIAYPEWDYRLGGYRQHGATVRLCTPALGDPAWATAVLRKRQALLQSIQRRFEGLRPRRVRQDRQADGDDVDIGAYVQDYAERRAGLPLQERWYQSVRPARRDIAIALLIDISGSTDGWVTQDLRIIDVEKEALLLVYRALLALGDPFCMQAFSGEGPHNVALWPLKSFDEAPGSAIECRIAALEPQRYTRAGAALRHTTALLNACVAEHRLLIMLSDGKPNDIDHYEGRYGVEDMRQAVAEATLQAIHPFCLTVDRHAPQYLGSVFGPGRYAVLQHPARLPVVLVEILRALIKT